MQDTYREIVDRSVENAGFIKQLEYSVPRLLRFYTEEFISGQKQRQKQALKGIEEIGDMLIIANEEILSESEHERLLELHKNFLEAYCLLAEYYHG